MKKTLFKYKISTWVLLLFLSINVSAQTLEWRLVAPVYSNVDPDGAGLATGTIRFTLQIHTLSGTLPNVTGLSTGWSWQSLKALLPTNGPVLPFCGVTNPPTGQPSNIVMSATWAGLGFTYNNVNQCSGTVNISAGGQIFDRRSSGTVDGGSITLTTAWTDVFTATLWTLDNVSHGGYVAINSGAGGSPGAFPTYAVSDADANEYVVNSLTYANPLSLGAAAPLPVLFTKFNAQCQADKSISVTWSTSQETNNNYFEVEKTLNGVTWTTVQKVVAGANSSAERNYQIVDPQGGTAQYRLKQVDKDGKTAYSTTVKTSCEGRNVYVTLYPVPARDVVNLVIGSDKAVKTNLQIYDSKGKLVVNMAASISQGVNNFKIPVQALAAGEYFIKGTNAELEISKRFTIAR